ncbi:MAG: hypothetical protein ACAH80_00260 [Alphaproteobacteria bacterium]
MSLSPEDKQKLRDAFQRALERDPAGADRPFTLEGMNASVTHRHLIANTLKGDHFFDSVEVLIKEGKGTIDDYVKQVENIKFPKP